MASPTTFDSIWKTLAKGDTVHIDLELLRRTFCCFLGHLWDFK